MALYLIHTPLIYWIKIALHGEIGLAVVGKNPEVEFPAWPGIPLHILASIISAALLTKLLEEPARYILKKIVFSKLKTS